MAYRLPNPNAVPVRVRASIMAGEVPVASEVEEGELALNSADGVIYTKNNVFPSGDGIKKIVALTQAEYDALTPVATTLYVITD